MSTQTNQEHGEQSNTQNYAVNGQQNKENSSELLHQEKIVGTPLTIVGNEDKGYFIALGRYRLTEPIETIDAAYGLLESQQWNIISNMIATMISINEEMKKEDFTINSNLSLSRVVENERQQKIQFNEDKDKLIREWKPEFPEK